MSSGPIEISDCRYGQLDAEPNGVRAQVIGYIYNSNLSYSQMTMTCITKHMV